MVKLLVAKVTVTLNGGVTAQALVPVDDADREAFKKIGSGEIVTADVKHTRNIKRLRFYWALCTLVWNNIPNELHPTAEDFSDSLKIMVGHRVRVWIPPGVQLEDGSVTGPAGIMGYRPKSINFATIDEIEFAQFVDRCVELIVKWFLPTVTRAQVFRQIEEMTGLRPWWEEEAARHA